MSNEDGDDNGEHRQTDQAASGSPPEQPNPGESPHSAAFAQNLAYITQHIAYLAQQQALAQQGAYYAALAAAQQNPYASLGLGLQQNVYNQWVVQNAFTSGGQVYRAPDPLPPIEDAGISAGEIIGHRVWRLLDNGWLGSMAVDVIWSPDEPMTLGVAHNLPESLDEGGGVHAFKTQTEAFSNYSIREGPCVYGTVALWGKVIEHERGYRAEFGKILSVDHITGVYFWRELRLLREIRQRYGLTQ